jgi:mannose/cellobiose epimerase-like protein (N-acyl-D-glucosamine 2-epimerase family)
MADTQNQTAHVVSAGPLAQDIEAQVQAAFVNPTKVKFAFRTTKVKEGDTEKDWKRPTLEMELPLLTKQGLAAALASDDAKVLELILDSVNASIIDRQRGIVNEKIDSDPSIDLATEAFDLNELTLAKIANLPKGERGAGIPKEIWAGFVKDYKEAMQTPEAVQLFADKKPRAPDVLDKHGVLLAGKFNQVRSRKDVVQQMLGFLDIWAQVSTNAEEFSGCYELLRNKGQTILQGEEFNDL